VTNPPSATRVAVAGAGLIALAYGVARFAFGLFVPSIRADLGLQPDLMGIIGSIPFISFAVTSLVASTLARRLGARRGAMLASGFGAVGLILMSNAGGAPVLAVGVFACGICTGLMMPALSEGIHKAVQPHLHGRVNAVMNAGTSVGVLLSVPTVLLLANAWRGAYASFAALAVLGVLAAAVFIPATHHGQASAQLQLPTISVDQRRRLIKLNGFALGMGLVSAAYWVFAPDLVVVLGGLRPDLTGWLWAAVGLAGLAGAAAGDLGERFGAGRVQSLALALLSLATLLVLAAPDSLASTVLSAALFGLAYMTLTGLYLVTAILLLPDHPSLGGVLPFLAIAVGQALGSTLTGMVVDQLGYAAAFGGMALLGGVLAAGYPFFPAPLPRPRLDPGP
jgi:predicted MFS family arabinose efflux permease